MADREVVTRVTFKAGGDVAEKVKDMGKSTKVLYDSEEKYQKLLSSRVAAIGAANALLETQKRLQGDLEKLGIKPTAEEEYQKKLHGTIAGMEERKRLATDLEKLGAVPKALTAEQKLTAEVEKRIARLNEEKKIGEEIKRREPLKTFEDKVKDAVASQREKNKTLEEEERIKRRLVTAGVATSERDKFRDSIMGRKQDEKDKKKWLDELVSEGALTKKEAARHGATEKPAGPQGGGPIAGAMDEMFGTKLGGMLGKVAGPLAAVAAGAHMANAAFKVLNDASLTRAQMEINLAKQIPIIGAIIEAGEGWADRQRGNAERIYNKELSHTEEMTRMSFRTDRNVAMDDALARRRHYEETERAFGGFKPAALRATDRSTAAGEIAYAEEQKRLPLIDARDMGKAELGVIRREKAETLTDLKTKERQREAILKDLHQKSGLQQALVDQQNRPSSTGRRIGYFATLGGGYLADQSDARQMRTAAGRDVEAAAAAVENKNKEIAADRARLESLTTKEIEKQADLRKNSIELNKTELDILQQKEGRLKSQAQGFGEMRPWERQRALRAIEGSQGNTWDQMTEFQRDYRRRLNPAAAAIEARKAGEASPEYKRLQAEGEFETGRIGATQGQQVSLQQQIREAVAANEKKLAKDFSEAIIPALARLLDTVRSDMVAAIEKLKAAIQIRNAQK